MIVCMSCRFRLRIKAETLHQAQGIIAVHIYPSATTSLTTAVMEGGSTNLLCGNSCDGCSCPYNDPEKQTFDVRDGPLKKTIDW